MKLTREIFTEVVSAYSAGVKVRDIAKNFNVDIRWVFRCVEKTDQEKYKAEKYDIQS